MTSPRAFRRDLTERANKEAQARGETGGDLLQQFYYDRLLARLFTRDPDGWLVKGGQALLRRYRQARHTRDLDLLYKQAGADLHEAVAHLREAAALDLNDHLRFEFRDASPITKGSHAQRVRFTLYVGNTEITVISVDLVTGQAPFGRPTTRALEPCIPDTGVTDWPELRLYPIVDHVADKVCAMYERHGEEGIPSSRYRDLVDLLLIALREDIDGAELQRALRCEANRRRARGVNLSLPRTFEVPDAATWNVG